LKGKVLLILFWVLLPVIVRFVSMSYPYIVNVRISSAEVVEGNKLRLKGTIKIDPEKIPNDLKQYYQKTDDFLSWWKGNINDVIENYLPKFWSKFIRVTYIDLWWEDKDKNVIGFNVIVSVAIGK
jgi:hypothetical protein